MLGCSLLALLLAGGGPPLPAFEQRTCPSSQPIRGEAAGVAPLNDAEKHAEALSRAACFRGAMEAAAKDATGLASQAQAAYAEWLRSACALTEELSWTDVQARLRRSGTWAGLGEAVCLASGFGERAFFLRDRSGFDGVLHERQAIGATIRVELARLLSLARAEGRLPPSAAPGALTASDLAKLTGAVDRVWEGAVEVAQAQCGALETPTSRCVALWENYLLGFVNPWALPGTPAPPPAPAAAD